jgi:hypothetical protein
VAKALRNGDVEPWRVHNHGPEEGEGIACREYPVNGRLLGRCLIVAAGFE